jgi:hypothetical protein
MRTDFVLPGHRKNKIAPSCLSDVLSRRMSIFLLKVIKNDFDEGDEAMFRGVKGPCEIIFCILGFNDSDVLSRRMPLRTHNLPSGRLKKMTLVKSMKGCFKV